MIRIVLIFLVCCMPMTLAAQQVFVQTGEHAAFTRVVVRLPQPRTWEFGRVAGGYALRLPVSVGYDLDKFFDIIPRRRIIAVSQDARRGELVLRVNCPCHADLMPLPDGYLVIDIKDGPPPVNSAYEARLDQDPRAFVANNILPIIIDPITDPQMPPATALQPELTAPTPAPSIAQDLAEFEDMLVESLGQGLTVGALTAQTVATPDQAPTPQTQTRDPLPGIEVRTGLDPAAIPPDLAVPVDRQGIACPADDMFDLPTWAAATPFVEQFAQMRGALIRDFDAFDPQAVTDLAKFYLYFGFGREAVQTLALDQSTSQERGYLQLIAAVLDDDPYDIAQLERQIACPSRVALWAMLALPETALNTTADTAAILRSFKELPQHLQIHLGPRLSSRLLVLGADDAATQVLGAAQLAAPARLDTQLVETSLATQRGDDDAAMGILADITASNSRITPDAMVRFLRSSVQQGRPVSASDMILADALRFEHAQTAIIAELATAQVQAHLANLAFDAAAQIMAAEANSFTPEQQIALNDDFARAAIAGMPDADFLPYAIAARGLSPAILGQMAERLTDMGFAESAVALLPDIDPALTDIALRQAKARALLAIGDIAAAAPLLRGDDTPHAEMLRDMAENIQAGRLPAGSDNPVSDQWRSGDWRGLTQIDDPLLRQAATAVLDPLAQFDAQIPLTSGRDILGQAAQSRQIVDALFQRFASPEDL